MASASNNAWLMHKMSSRANILVIQMGFFLRRLKEYLPDRLYAIKVSSYGKGQVQKHWYSFLSYNASNFMFFLFLGSNFNTLLILLIYFLCPLMLLLFISASFIDNYLPMQRVYMKKFRYCLYF